MARKTSSAVATRKLIPTAPEDLPAVPEPKPARIKRTFHIEPELVLLLDELQLQEFRATGQKPELSNLVSEGIRLLGQSRQQNGQKSEQAAS